MAEQHAGGQLLAKTERLVTWQMELWQKSLEEMRDRWTTTLSQQQEQLNQALQAGLKNTLSDHSRQLSDLRTEFIAAFQISSNSISRQLAETSTILADHTHRGSEQIVRTWQQFRDEITRTRDEHTRQLALLTQAISAEVGGWQDQLGSNTQSMCQTFEELRQQGKVFLKISEQGSELNRLENRLAQNLESLRVVESLEQTLLNLNAAVNLLTARAKSKAA